MFTVLGVDVAVSNTSVQCCSSGFPLYCCQTTKYFILLWRI